MSGTPWYKGLDLNNEKSVNKAYDWLMTTIFSGPDSGAPVPYKEKLDLVTNFLLGVKESAAARIQRMRRGMVARRLARKESAAARIQRMRRGMVARRLAQKIRMMRRSPRIVGQALNPRILAQNIRRRRQPIQQTRMIFHDSPDNGGDWGRYDRGRSFVHGEKVRKKKKTDHFKEQIKILSAIIKMCKKHLEHYYSELEKYNRNNPNSKHSGLLKEIKEHQLQLLESKRDLNVAQRGLDSIDIVNLTDTMNVLRILRDPRGEVTGVRGYGDERSLYRVPVKYIYAIPGETVTFEIKGGKRFVAPIPDDIFKQGLGGYIGQEDKSWYYFVTIKGSEAKILRLKEAQRMVY